MCSFPKGINLSPQCASQALSSQCICVIQTMNSHNFCHLIGSEFFINFAEQLTSQIWECLLDEATNPDRRRKETWNIEISALNSGVTYVILLMTHFTFLPEHAERGTVDPFLWGSNRAVWQNYFERNAFWLIEPFFLTLTYE